MMQNIQYPPGATPIELGEKLAKAWSLCAQMQTVALLYDNKTDDRRMELEIVEEYRRLVLMADALLTPPARTPNPQLANTLVYMLERDIETGCITLARMRARRAKHCANTNR
jgi:hypothetical protein